MTAVLTPAGSSGAGAGWTPGRSRTSWPTARKQATSVLMAPTPACDPATARAKAEARGYGRGAARAFAGFLNPRNSPDAGRLDGVEGPRGAVREPVEATIAPIDEAVAHVADGSPTKLDELRKRAEQRGYGRGAALAFAGLLSPASPALLKTPGAERSWAALDEAARSLADDAFAAAVEPAETPPAVREAPAPSPPEVRWYDDRAPSPVRQERRDAGATERFRRKAAKAKENGEDAQREARQREGELNRERARVYAAEQRVKQRLETIRRQERAVEAHEAARSGAARRAFRAWRRALATPSPPEEASGYGEGAARALRGPPRRAETRRCGAGLEALGARRRPAPAPGPRAAGRRGRRFRRARAAAAARAAATRGRRGARAHAAPPAAGAAAAAPAADAPDARGPRPAQGVVGDLRRGPLVGLSPPEAPPQYPLTQKVAQELKAIIFPVPEHLRADPAPAPAPAAAPADMSAYDDDDDDAPAPAPAPEAADMTAYDDDGSEAPTLTRDDGAAADMGAYEDDGSEAPAADPSAPEDDGAAAADLSLYADDASDDADDWPVRSASPAVERPATAGVSVSLEDEPSPPFATPREPYEPAAFARAAVDLSTPLKPPSIYERARGAARAPAVAEATAPAADAETSPRPPLTGKRATLSPGNVDELDFRPDKAVAAAPAAAPPEASDAFAVPPTPHNSRSDLADDEATEPGVRSYPADDAVAAAAAAPHDVEPAPVAEAIVRAAPPPTRATEPSDPAADAVAAAEADATVEEAAAKLGLGAVARLGTAAARVRRMRRRKPSEAMRRVLAEVERGHALRSAPPVEAAAAPPRAPSPAVADGCLRSRLSQSAVVDAKLKADLVPGAAATLAAIRATDEPTARRAATAVASAVRRASDPQRQALLRDLGSRPTSPSAAQTMLAGRSASPSASLVYEGVGGVVAPQKYVETKAALVPPPPRETPPAAPTKLSPEVEERRTSLKPVDGVPLATISPRKKRRSVGGPDSAFFTPSPSAPHEFQSRRASLKRVARDEAPAPRAILREAIGDGAAPAELQPEFLARRASLKRVVRDDAPPVSAPEPPIPRQAIGKGTAPPPTRPTAPSLDEMEAEVARERGEARLREAVAKAKAERAAAERIAAEEAERARLEAERMSGFWPRRPRLSGWRRSTLPPNERRPSGWRRRRRNGNAWRLKG